MRKVGVFLSLVIVAILMCGMYGIIHDQITYSISHEYYSRFKFYQFRLLDGSLPNRLKVLIVGWKATWWMGIPIGILVGSAGFIHESPSQMWQVTLRSYLIAVATAMAVGFIGLGYGCWRTSSIDVVNYRDWFLPEGLSDLRSFLCVGYMHNASYLGGVVAIPVAWFFHIRFRRKSQLSQPPV